MDLANSSLPDDILAKQVAFNPNSGDTLVICRLQSIEPGDLTDLITSNFAIQVRRGLAHEPKGSFVCTQYTHLSTLH